MLGSSRVTHRVLLPGSHIAGTVGTTIKDRGASAGPQDHLTAYNIGST